MTWKCARRASCLNELDPMTTSRPFIQVSSIYTTGRVSSLPACCGMASPAGRTCPQSPLGTFRVQSDESRAVIIGSGDASETDLAGNCGVDDLENGVSHTAVIGTRACREDIAAEEVWTLDALLSGLKSSDVDLPASADREQALATSEASTLHFRCSW